jgi:hypothetical protein
MSKARIAAPRRQAHAHIPMVAAKSAAKPSLVSRSSCAGQASAPVPAPRYTMPDFAGMAIRQSAWSLAPVRRSAQQSSAGAGGLVVSDRMQSGIASLQRRGGSPLPAGTRSFMEQRFGHDFSRVRVHADGNAAELAGGLGARAFTVGSDIVFGGGEYRPHTREGTRLLAHELTHTVQAPPGHIQRQQCAYGEIRSWAIVSQSDLSAPAGLGDAVASLEASCARGQPCSCIDGAGATAPGDQAAWQNINAATGTDLSGGGEYMCVGTQGCEVVRRCYQCNGTRRERVNRATPLAPVGQATVAGKGTLYFYTDPLQGWCNAADRRSACRPPAPRRGTGR